MGMGPERLLPCPFCGGEASFERVECSLGRMRWTVGCNETDEDDAVLCYGYQSLTTFATKRDAAEAWNRRTAAPAQPSREVMQIALMVLCWARDGHTWHSNTLKDFDCAIGGLHAALALADKPGGT